MTFENLDLLVPADLAVNKVPMLIGEPGIGKSSWVEALASRLGTKCFTLAVNQLADKADLTGARLTPVQEADGTTGYEQQFFPHQIINQANAYAENHPTETPILFLDEINRTTPDVTSEALSIPTARSIGAKRLPDNLRVITAGNDKGNVQSLDQASITRFVLYRVQPDIATFLAVNPGLSPYVAKVLKKNPNYLFLNTTVAGVSQSQDDDDDAQAVLEFDMEDTMDQITTPRTVTAVSDWLNSFSYDELMSMVNTPDGEQTLLQSALEAHTGRTMFTLALMDEIVSSQAAQQKSTTLVAPRAYASLCAATSRDALNAALSGLTDEEKSSCLVYALYDKRDNSNLLSVLAPAITRIAPGDMTDLINLAQQKRLDKGNYDTLCSISCLITSIILSMKL